ncbi:TetR/AcrR family transcriptional regulator [Actinokineospora sp. NBRC 105648]|uniref:TetR/AcrR family transcriptional regulator n=1 Tax=Actinokineospora sp. NBRC 105648 TaxID=3032206 RepID=UPI0024A4416D|nr:TetR/AcrR family transcriptional regulator [Actinokineospora sp. NBRC 105648]GLZ36517.1 TetR family transcriptional regulator [Actinokineospora sp. NBRC 105648]
MPRLSRIEAQERNRARVLAAARAEFAERGYREAKVDAIAERAELTRGAVYSNFPGKRALYFAVLADLAERAPGRPHAAPGRTSAEAVGALARAWVAGLPDELGAHLLAEVAADVSVRRAFAQLLQLDALLLGLALERLDPPASPPGAPPARRVRLAETILTTLHGATALSAAAPAFGEPFDIVSACERLAGLPMNDWWSPPREAAPVRAVGEPWRAPEVVDLVTGAAFQPGDGVVVVLGLDRLDAVEEAVRLTDQVTLVLVTSQPDELLPLSRLVITQLAGCLRQAFPRQTWPRLRVVGEPSLAAAAGVSAAGDGTEVAVRVVNGRVVARAEGFHACHTIAANSSRSTNAALSTRN